MGPYGSKKFKTLLILQFMINKVVIREYKVMTNWWSAKNKFVWHFEFLLTQDCVGLEIIAPTIFIRSEPNFMINRAVIREYKVIFFAELWKK